MFQNCSGKTPVVRKTISNAEDTKNGPNVILDKATLISQGIHFSREQAMSVETLWSHCEYAEWKMGCFWRQRIAKMGFECNNLVLPNLSC